MVGVPHSTGCSRCRERRIKCDKATPECSQCRRYGRPCPGYQRTFRFQDEGPALERRHLSSTGRVSKSSATFLEPFVPDAAKTVRDSALAMIRRYASMGEDYANTGSPTQILLEKQHIQCFGDFIRTAFPTMYYHNRFRATDRPDFPSFVIQDVGSHIFQDAAVACLSSVYLAYLSQDATLLKTSRQMYAQTLHEVARALQTPDAMSDAMLCTMMMLSVYEMYAQTSKDAWVIHADGVRRLMVSRGAQSHAQGMARSCYIAYRGFSIATAVYKGNPCFLDAEEWQQLSLQIGLEDSQKPTEWSSSIHPAELVFIEIVKCPRYLSEALELAYLFPSPSVTAAIPDLMQRVQSTIESLREASVNLRVSMDLDQRLHSIPPQEDVLVGEPGPSLLLQGAENTLVILTDLLERLARALCQPEDTAALSFRVVTELDRGPPVAPSPRIDFLAVTWLDRIASSMGMIGTAIVQD
ncbi:Zn(II)2Cys6 transcription factor [Aspergillus lucknowensis]|uniref:Zn(2)-C6 fungal-type domain-containing protein n=1 Tax=Aspergillus lucknowensis TaxID=176173 RepID=A0ABR4M1C6_9EURO